MKKFLAMTLAIFLLCVAQVSAKEYYCGKSSDGFKVYFLSESAARYDSNPPKFTGIRAVKAPCFSYGDETAQNITCILCFVLLK